jgi:predicted nucleic acid-binding protein
VVNAYFIDSSALVKRYVAETGTAWIQEITAPFSGNQLIIARITWVEVFSALARRQREDGLSSADHRSSRRLAYRQPQSSLLVPTARE